MLITLNDKSHAAALPDSFADRLALHRAGLKFGQVDPLRIYSATLALCVPALCPEGLAGHGYDVMRLGGAVFDGLMLAKVKPQEVIDQAGPLFDLVAADVASLFAPEVDKAVEDFPASEESTPTS